MENGRKRRVASQTKVDQNGGSFLVTFTINGKKCYVEKKCSRIPEFGVKANALGNLSLNLMSKTHLFMITFNMNGSKCYR